jgi:hypothetical protein
MKGAQENPKYEASDFGFCTFHTHHVLDLARTRIAAKAPKIITAPGHAAGRSTLTLWFLLTSTPERLLITSWENKPVGMPSRAWAASKVGGSLLPVTLGAENWGRRRDVAGRSWDSIELSWRPRE